MAKIAGKLDYGDTPVTLLNLNQERKRLVPAAIVDVNDLPAFSQALQHRSYGGMKSDDIFFFVINWYYDGKHGPTFAELSP